ncbi:glycosyl transferase family 1 [Ornithinimicrobium humiphilum]|uniref:Glycosyl transferase family 1 n=1 Tax=Ornithinimicrobium humiphilum TaxID=125288 RepID=A0A543KJL9_9MICO|nr:glycosyltransferase family 4 protein [Ornithinimicrobium humiphilum]TQM95275.1 glycosyl transferase family 1 [Ornithinimicrobium humiphilum]
MGTVRARAAVRALPAGAIAICHNDALAGHVYVNHGVLRAAMRARGHYAWRMVRNPLHLLTEARDALRYRSGVHRVVVNLTQEDDRTLCTLNPHLRSRTVVIGNGVDLERFTVPTETERLSAREELDLREEDILTVFVGHEFERKGLFQLLEAMAGIGDRHHLAVVGGTESMISDLHRRVAALGLGARTHLLGVQDPRPVLAGADLLAQPSRYESYGLVVVEALATGVPVMSTPVGIAPEVLEEGVTGYLTDGTPADMARILALHERQDRKAMRGRARGAVADHSWSEVARQYLELFRTLDQKSGP